MGALQEKSVRLHRYTHKKSSVLKISLESDLIKWMRNFIKTPTPTIF